MASDKINNFKTTLPKAQSDLAQDILKDEYNLELRSYVVIELKTGEFKPEYAGKLGFYLSALDEKLKHEDDKDTIGIILCSKNNKEVSRHAVKYMMKPLGVSEYKISEEIIDKKVRNIMPSAQEISERLRC